MCNMKQVCNVLLSNKDYGVYSVSCHWAENPFQMN